MAAGARWSEGDVPDQAGRVAVVTGGNGGLGLETVRALVRRGAHVIVGARDLRKAADAQAAVVREMPGALLEVLALDLGSLASIRSFAEEVVSRRSTVDTLYCNAGVMATPQGTTADGFETQFGINHLGHFDLTRALFPALCRADQGRVVVTTSSARIGAGPYDLTDPHHRRRRYEPWEAYGYSKLANLQFALQLDALARAAGLRVTAFAADPGLSHTDLQHTTAKNLPGASQRLASSLVRRIGQPAAAGALEQLRAGTDPDAVGGTLYRPRWFLWGAPVAGSVPERHRRPDQLAQLWTISEEAVGASFDVASHARSA